MKSLFVVFAVMVVIAAVALLLWMAKGTHQLTDMQRAYQPSPGNQCSIEVLGWRENEVDRILADFRGIYGLPASALFATRVSDGYFRVSFPNDIEPRIFYFLVNYIQYPKGMDLQSRKIGVLGRAKLSPAFGIPDSSLNGMSAKVYVPANDKEFDNVYVLLESGKAFKVPFTRLIWESVDDPSIPDEFRNAQKG